LLRKLSRLSFGLGMKLYCDNYSTCGGWFHDRGDLKITETWARAKGWHIYHGLTQEGVPHDAVLCEACSGSRRRALPRPPPTLTEQEQLFEL